MDAARDADDNCCGMQGALCARIPTAYDSLRTDIVSMPEQPGPWWDKLKPHLTGYAAAGAILVPSLALSGCSDSRAEERMYDLRREFLNPGFI